MDQLSTESPESVRPRRLSRWVGVSLIVVGGLGLGGAFLVVKRAKSREIVSLAVDGRRAAEEGRYEDAFRLLSQASDADQTFLEYAKAAGLAAIAIGRFPEAARYGQRAWAGGLRDEGVLGAVLAAEAGAVDAEASIRRGSELIAQVPDAASRLRLRIRLLMTHGRVAQAADILQELLRLEPTAQVVAAYAELLIRQEHTAEAMALLQEQRQLDRLDAMGYRLLGTLQTKENFSFDDPRKRYDVLALYAEARERHQVDDALRLEHAQYEVTRLDLAAAKAILAEISGGPTDVAARVLEAWVWSSLGHGSEWPVPPRERVGGVAHEGLAMIASAFTMAKAGDRIFALEKSERLVGEHAALHLLIARELVASSDLERALVRYRQVHGLLASSPAALLEQARVLALLNKRSEAINTILALHRWQGPSKYSLLMLDALVGQDMPVNAISAMRSLAEQHRDDHQLQSFAEGLAKREAAQGAPAELALDQAARTRVAAIRQLIVKGEGGSALKELEGSEFPQAVLESLRGFALQGLNRHADAVLAFTASRIVDQPASLHLAEAISALRSGQRALAIAAASRAVAMLPSDVLGWRILVTAWIAEGRAAEGLPLLEKADGLPESERNALRGSMLAWLGRDEDALAACAAALTLVPRHQLALTTSADILLRGDRPKDVLALLSAEELQRDPDIAVRRLIAQLALSDLSAAVATLDGLSDETARKIDADSLRVRLLARSGDLRAAQRAYDGLPKSLPAARRAVLSALIHELGGRTAAAIFAVRPYLNDVSAASVWARLTLISDPQANLRQLVEPLNLPQSSLRCIAEAAFANRRWHDAVEVTQMVRTRWPDDAIALNDWAWYAFHDQGSDKAEVAAVAVQACAAIPGNPVPMDTAAEILLAYNRPDECLTVLDGHPEVVARELQLQYHRARALAALARRDEATVAYRAVLASAEAFRKWPLRGTQAEVTAELQALIQPVSR